MRWRSSRGMRPTVMLICAVALGASATIVATSVPAVAAAGSPLFTESFSGASVANPRVQALDQACLTGAAAGSTPPVGASDLSNCDGRTNNSPAEGALPGWLQLTDNRTSATGGMIYNSPLPSSAGLIAEFDQAQYGGGGADGIGFFLTDGSHSLTHAGASGASLGYAPAGTTNPGVAGGYLGVGLDAFGGSVNLNWAASTCPPSPYTSRVGNAVTLRGPGNDFAGYCLLAATAAAPTGPSTLPGTLRGASATNVRNVRVTVSPGAFPVVTVQIDFTGTRTDYQTVLSYTMTDAAPPTYKFGFSGSTGGISDVHLIRNASFSSILPLGQLNLVKQIDNTTPQPPSYGVGDVIPYQFVVTNTGVSTISSVTVTDPQVTDVSCPATVLGAAGTATGSMTCTGSHTVTGTEAQSASFTNTATATGTELVNGQLTATSSVTVPITIAHAALAMTKTAQLQDTNANGLADIGEQIQYGFRVTNAGNTQLTGLAVSDPKVGAVTCTPTTVAAGATSTCTAAPYTVTEADILAGGVTNSATATGTPPVGVPAAVPASDTIVTPTAAAAGGLALTKNAALNDTNGNGLADAGETIQYSFALRNTGTVTLTGVGVTDATAGPVTCPTTTLAVGAGTTCTADSLYTVTEADLIAGGVQNSATADATPPNGVPAIIVPSDTIVTPTSVAAAGLHLSKAAALNDTNGNGLADVGETIQYGFTVENTGNLTVTGIVVSDPNAGPVTCAATTLSPGASTTCSAGAPYTVTDADVVAGAVSNTATATATPPDGVPAPTPATDTIVTPTPAAAGGLALTKTATLNDTNADGLADIGETIRYSFTLRNTGTVTLTGVGVTDAKAGAVTCPATTLAPDESTTCTADNLYTVTAADILAGGVENTASADATPPNGVPAIVAPTTTIVTPTPIAGAGMHLTKTAALNDTNGDGLADVGETIRYGFTVQNTGNVALTGVTVSDPNAGTVTCLATDLDPGASTTCTAGALYTVTDADVVAGGVTNTATATATPPNGVPAPSPAADTIVTPTPAAGGGLALTKAAALNDTNGNGLADLCESIQYTFTLRNTGTATLTGAGITDAKVGAVTCPVTTLAPGESTNCSADSPYTVTTADILAGGVENTASADATPPNGIPAIIAPTTTIVTPTAVAGAGMHLTKTAALNDTNGDGLADVGETIQYGFTVENTGNVPLTGITVGDANAGTVTCAATALDPGDSTTCTAAALYTVTDADIIAGGVANAATATGTAPNGVPAPMPSTDSIVTPTPAASTGLAIIKIATLGDTNTNGLADLGETIAYSFALTNRGSITLTDPVVTDAKAGAVTCSLTTLPPGATTICDADALYTVSEADILAGAATNTATADAAVPTGAPAIVPATDSISVPTVLPNAVMTVDLRGSLRDGNGNGLADAGEVIDYAFEVTNTGNVTLTGITVGTNILNVSCPSTSLPPGATMVCTASHTVTLRDQAAGDVAVDGTVSADAPSGVQAPFPVSVQWSTPTAPVPTAPGTPGAPGGPGIPAEPTQPGGPATGPSGGLADTGSTGPGLAALLASFAVVIGGLATFRHRRRNAG